jgi:hypothetical protein
MNEGRMYERGWKTSLFFLFLAGQPRTLLYVAARKFYYTTRRTFCQGFFNKKIHKNNPIILVILTIVINKKF